MNISEKEMSDIIDLARNGPNVCEICGVGVDIKGSACYKYYSCGHTYTKLLCDCEIQEKVNQIIKEREKQEKFLQEFSSNLANQQEELDEEIEKILYDNLWELYEEENI